MIIPWNNAFPLPALENSEQKLWKQKTAPPVLKVSGRDCQFMYSVRVSCIFGTAETKDETADRAEEEQHKTKTNTMAKCFGQLNGLLDEQKNDTIVT